MFRTSKHAASIGKSVVTDASGPLDCHFVSTLVGASGSAVGARVNHVYMCNSYYGEDIRDTY